MGCKVVGLRRQDRSHQWEIDLEKGPPIKADGICLALPAHQSAGLLEALDPWLAAKLRSVEHASTATINLAYSAEDIPAAMDGFGFLVPAVEKGSILACSYSHRKFAGRAPRNGALLRAFVGGALQPETLDDDDQELIARVRRTLGDLLGITRPPLLSRVERHPKAMPQYGVGHLGLVDRIETRFAQLALPATGGKRLHRHWCPGLYSAGRAMHRQVAGPHFSPGGVMMAQEFFPQRVLASKERSGHYVRASMCALRGKGQARARPAPCVTARHHNRTNKLLKINPLSSFIGRPGEKWGLSPLAP